MKREMPSQEEIDAVAWYVLKRPLTRPNTNYKKAAMYVLLFILVNIGMTLLLNHLFKWQGIFSLLPMEVASFITLHPIGFGVIVAILQFLGGTVIVLKRAIIGAIRLYQRYAPEEIRRRCLFKPTCSEYAILALEKYGVIRGGYKAYIRLFKKCKGRIYRIDEP